jgi:hypothetical protein
VRVRARDIVGAMRRGFLVFALSAFATIGCGGKSKTAASTPAATTTAPKADAPGGCPPGAICGSLTGDTGGSAPTDCPDPPNCNSPSKNPCDPTPQHEADPAPPAKKN